MSGKIRKYDEERVFFHIFRSLHYKNGKAQNIPVLPGRLVFFPPTFQCGMKNHSRH